MAIPDYQSLMLPVLKCAAQGETRVPEVEQKITAEFGLTPEERDQLLPSGRQKILHNRIHWAKFYMSKAGLIDMPRRGWFKASEAGLALLARNPGHIDVKLLFEYPGFKDFYRGSHGNGNIPGTEDAPAVAPLPVAAATPEEQIESIYVAAQIALRAELLQRILQNTPSFFEGLIVDLLVAMGYGGSHRIRWPPRGARLRRQSRLGAAKGVFVTTSTFSQNAVDYAHHLAQRVILIDGHKLADLMIEHSVGVRVSRAVEFKRIDEDFFSEDE